MQNKTMHSIKERLIYTFDANVNIDYIYTNIIFHPAKPFIVTIDGPAGVGKSTLANSLAEFLDIPFLDTGAMFRTVAYRLGDKITKLNNNKLNTVLHDERKNKNENKNEPNSEPDSKLNSELDSLIFSLEKQEKQTVLYCNNIAIGNEIRNEEVAYLASEIAKNETVRNFLKKSQQQLGIKSSLVAEGRDMGTVVFPKANCKFFLDATAKERAGRRVLQLKESGKQTDFKQILKQIETRDSMDRNRAIAPLKAASDAILIDTTLLSLSEVKEQLFHFITKYIIAELKQSENKINNQC